MTGAERQARHRQKKHVTGKLETYDETNKRMWKLQDELKDYIDCLQLAELYAIKPLLYFLKNYWKKPEDMEKLCDLIKMVDFELSDPGDPEDDEED
jgi:hypothetical protein